MGQEWLQIQFQFSIGVILVLFLRICLRKFPKIIPYLLWCVVFVRLLCPISFASPIGLVQMPDDDRKIAADSGRTTDNINKEKNLSDTEKNHDFNHSISEPNPVLSQENKKDTQKDLTSKTSGTFLQKTNTLKENTKKVTQQILTGIHTKIKSSTGRLFLVSIWVAGMIGFLFYHGLAFYKVKKRIKESICVGNHIYETRFISTPFVAPMITWNGFRHTNSICNIITIHTNIYLPSGIPEREQHYIICHEQMHIKRKDHVVKWIAFLLLAIYWFQPFVWIAFYYLEQDMEMSCDEMVLAKLGMNTKKEYSQSLLNFATGRQSAYLLPLPFAKTGVKQRIKNVLEAKKMKKWMIILSIILVGAVGFSLFTFRQSNAKNTVPISEQKEQPIETQNPVTEETPKEYPTIFTYNDVAYDVREQNKNIRAIIEEKQIGDYKILNCQKEKDSNIYLLFHTKNLQFEKEIIGTHLIYKNEDVTTLLYELEGIIYDYDGNNIGKINLKQDEYVENMKFAKHGKLTVTIGGTQTDAKRTEKVKIIYPYIDEYGFGRRHIEDYDHQKFSELHEVYGEKFVDSYYVQQDKYPLKKADDKTPWTIRVFKKNAGDGESGLVLVGNEVLKPVDTIFSHTARASWNNIYLGKMDNDHNFYDFILEFHHENRDTHGKYSYVVYNLKENGDYVSYDGSYFEWGDNIKYDDARFKKWVEGLQKYLKSSKLILSTQNGEVRTDHICEADKYTYEKLKPYK